MRAVIIRIFLITFSFNLVNAPVFASSEYRGHKEQADDVESLGKSLIEMLARIEAASLSRGGSAYKNSFDSGALAEQLQEELHRIQSIAGTQSIKALTFEETSKIKIERGRIDSARYRYGFVATLTSAVSELAAASAFTNHSPGMGATIFICGIVGAYFGIRQMNKAQKDHKNREVLVELKTKELQNQKATHFLEELAHYINKHSQYTVAVIKEDTPRLSLANELCASLLQAAPGRTRFSEKNEPQELQLEEERIEPSLKRSSL